MPYAPRIEKGQRHGFDTFTGDMALVRKYTGLDFLQIGELDYIDFRILLRDAFINSLERTEEGRKYLYDAWVGKQTEPDRKRLRELFGRGRG